MIGARNASGSSTATTSDRSSSSALMSCSGFLQASGSEACANAGSPPAQTTLSQISSPLLAISEIDEETDHQPHEEPQPGFERQAEHQDQAAEDRDARQQRDQRHAKAARAFRLL